MRVKGEHIFHIRIPGKVFFVHPKYHFKITLAASLPTYTQETLKKVSLIGFLGSGGGYKTEKKHFLKEICQYLSKC